MQQWNIDNKLEWTTNTTAMYKKATNHFYLIRWLSGDIILLSSTTLQSEKSQKIVIF